MDFLIVLCYIIFAYGMAELFVFFDGPFDIINKFRKFCHWISPTFGKLFSCMACLSTWIGLLWSALDYWLVPIAITPFNIILGGTGMWYLIIFMDAMFTCGIVWLLFQLEEMLERTGEITYEDEEK